MIAVNVAKYNELRLGAAYTKAWSGATTAPNTQNAVALSGPEAGRIYYDVVYYNGSTTTRKLYLRQYSVDGSNAGSISSGTSDDVGDAVGKTVSLSIGFNYIQVGLDSNLIAGETLTVRIYIERTRFA